jgi:hypothetical protein
MDKEYITVTTIGGTEKIIGYTNDSWSRFDSGDYWRQEEWVDAFPSFDKVKILRKQHPALEKAYENFKTIYKLVESENKTDK